MLLQTNECWSKSRFSISWRPIVLPTTSSSSPSCSFAGHSPVPSILSRLCSVMHLITSTSSVSTTATSSLHVLTRFHSMPSIFVCFCSWRSFIWWAMSSRLEASRWWETPHLRRLLYRRIPGRARWSRANGGTNGSFTCWNWGWLTVWRWKRTSGWARLLRS